MQPLLKVMVFRHERDLSHTEDRFLQVELPSQRARREKGGVPGPGSRSAAAHSDGEAGLI